MKNAKIILLFILSNCINIYAQEISTDTNKEILLCVPVMEESVEEFSDYMTSTPTTIVKETQVAEVTNVELAVKKAYRLVETFAPHKDKYGNATKASFLPYVRELVEYCYYIAELKNEPGFAHTWYWALVYGMSNFGLTCYGVAPGNCAGPFNVKKYPLVRDPVKNMQHHVQEQFTGWKRGCRGIDLCRYVMYD